LRRRRPEARGAVERGATATAAAVDGIEEGTWAQMAPLLDEAVASLRESDRQAVLLRFYEGRSFAQVAEALGVSEVAARKRVSRAVERLGAFFKRRGVGLTAAAALAAMLMTAQSAMAAPAALVATVSAAGSAGGAGAGVGTMALTLVRGASGRMAAARRRLAAAIVACMGLVGAGVCTALLMGGPREEALPRFDALPAEQQPMAERTIDGLFGEAGSSPRSRRLHGTANFEITPVAQPPGELPMPPTLDAISWVSRWLVDRNAAALNGAFKAAAAARRDGAGGEGPIDPVTGRQMPPGKQDDADEVQSFANMAGGGGGGGVSAGGAKDAATASVSTAGDGAARSGSGGGDAWRGATAEVVVASSSSATSSSAAATGEITLRGTLNTGPTWVLGSGATTDTQLTFYSPGTSGYYVVRQLTGGVERYLLLKSNARITLTGVARDTGPDVAVDGPVIVVQGPAVGNVSSIGAFVNWLSEADPAVAAKLAEAFPQGLNLDDPSQLAAFENFLAEYNAPAVVQGNGLGAVATPEPGGAGVMLVGVAVSLMGRRRRRSVRCA
jgi:hypothetical protein